MSDQAEDETFEALVRRPGLRIERIVSHGQVTPPDTPWLQAHDEWVMLISGEARLRFADGTRHHLTPGDHLLIPRDVAHWVTYTAIGAPTVWLAVHFPLDEEAGTI